MINQVAIGYVLIAIGVNAQLSGCRPAAVRTQSMGTVEVLNGGNSVGKKNTPEGTAVTAASPSAVVSAPQGYPPLSALGRLGQLRLHDAPTQLVDGDLATGLPCKGQAQECSVNFRLSKAARIEVIRLYFGRTGKDPFDTNPTPANATNSGAKDSDPIEEVTVQLSALGVERTITAQVTQDFFHWNEAIELPAGEVSLKIKSRTQGSKISIFVNDLALFSSSGERVNVAWKPEAMLVRAKGPFYHQGPDFSMLSTLAFAEEIQSDLRVIRRFPASEVIPLEGTEYALVRRDGAVSCPGAFHNYEQSYVVLDRRSGLLAFWQNSITASLFRKETRVRSRSYSVATDEETELELNVLLQRVSSKQLSAKPLSDTNRQPLEAQGFRQLPEDMARECRPVTAKEGEIYASVTPAATETKLGQAVLSCPLGSDGRLLVYTDPCWEEVGGVVTFISGIPQRLTVAEGASSIQLRRGPNQQWLMAIWRQDSGQVYRIEANGSVHLFFANAVFGTRQVESCRCSA